MMPDRITSSSHTSTPPSSASSDPPSLLDPNSYSYYSSSPVGRSTPSPTAQLPPPQITMTTEEELLKARRQRDGRRSSSLSHPNVIDLTGEPTPKRKSFSIDNAGPGRATHGSTRSVSPLYNQPAQDLQSGRIRGDEEEADLGLFQASSSSPSPTSPTQKGRRAWDVAGRGNYANLGGEDDHQGSSGSGSNMTYGKNDLEGGGGVGYPPLEPEEERESKTIEENLARWSTQERHKRASVRRQSANAIVLPNWPSTPGGVPSGIAEVGRRGSLLLRSASFRNWGKVDDGENNKTSLSRSSTGDSEGSDGGEINLRGRRLSRARGKDPAVPMERLPEHQEEEESQEVISSYQQTGAARSVPVFRTRDSMEEDEEGIVDPNPSVSQFNLAAPSTTALDRTPSDIDRSERARKTGSKFAEHLISQRIDNVGMGRGVRSVDSYSDQLGGEGEAVELQSPTSPKKPAPWRRWSKDAKGKGKSTEIPSDSGHGGSMSLDDPLIAGPAYDRQAPKRWSSQQPYDSPNTIHASLDGSPPPLSTQPRPAPQRTDSESRMSIASASTFSVGNSAGGPVMMMSADQSMQKLVPTDTRSSSYDPSYSSSDNKTGREASPFGRNRRRANRRSGRGPDDSVDYGVPPEDDRLNPNDHTGPRSRERGISPRRGQKSDRPISFWEWVMCGCFGDSDEDLQTGKTNPME